MNRILINEVDQTTVSPRYVEGTDIVYIPGFSSALDSSASAVKVKNPTLCTSVRDFEAKFGVTPPLFALDQYYPVADGTHHGFSVNAIPSYSESTPTTWFKAGDPDPSYMYAKELLSMGIPVIYERLNNYTTVLAAPGETIEEKKAAYDVTVDNFYTEFQDSLESSPHSYGEASISQCDTTVTVDAGIFSEHYPVADMYLFKYSLDGWLDSNGELVDLGTIGVTYTAVPTTEYEVGVGYAVGTYIKHTVSSVVTSYSVITEIAAADNTSWSAIQACVAEITVSNPIVPAINDTISIVLYHQDSLLLDKGQYSVKYITSGGYPTFEYDGKAISELMAGVAATRGDAIALIDHTNNPSRALIGQTSVYGCVSANEYMLRDAYQSYAAMFTPYAFYTLIANYGNVVTTPYAAFPPSFAYLVSLANSISTNPSWLAIAGVARGRVANLISVNLSNVLSNSVADSYQTDVGICINPITEIRPYGQCLWGNRTLVDNSKKGGTTALSFLNIRNLVCDIKKQLFVACQTLMFEQNTDVLWINFLSIVTPLLDRMVSGYGISNYKIIRENSSNKAKIVATVRIYPVYAVEGFDITVYLSDADVSVEE